MSSISIPIKDGVAGKMLCNLLCEVRERSKRVTVTGKQLRATIRDSQGAEPVVLQLEDPVWIIERQTARL
jgi:hypothetical protein